MPLESMLGNGTVSLLRAGENVDSVMYLDRQLWKRGSDDGGRFDTESQLKSGIDIKAS